MILNNTHVNKKSLSCSLFIIYFLITLFSPTTFVYAYEFPIESCPPENELFDHLSEQVDNRIDGVVADDTSKKLFTTRGNLTSPWVRNPDVWTNNDNPIDFTGMSPWNSRGGYTRAGTLITPRHIALANHYQVIAGDTILFVTEDDSIVTRTVESTQRVLTTDIWIAKLNSDVPETITHYPILSALDFEKYLGDGYETFGINDLPIVMFDQEDKALISGTLKSRLFSSGTLSHSVNLNLNINNRLDFYETLIGGDSGNAGFVLIGDKPVLILTHLTAASGPSYPFYKQDIQNVINSMGGEYQLSTIDLSCFESFIILENNFDLKILRNGANGTLVGTIDIKHNPENDTPHFSFVSGNEDGALNINSSTGEITIANSLLAVEPHFPRNIEIGVEKNGPGGVISKKLYTISIVGNPYFTSNNYNFNINEHSNIGTNIGQVFALDTENDTIVYSIVSGNENGIFSINSLTGRINVANSELLNFETNNQHILTVRATESETIQEFYSEIDVTINVLDTNYEFSEEAYLFEIDELDENNTAVGSVEAEILDTIDVESTYYKIVSGNGDGIFNINSTSGQITIIDNTNLDGNQIYNLVIGASENIDSPVLKSVNATINVANADRPTLSYEEQENSLVIYTVEEGSSVSMIFELSGPYIKLIVANLVQTSGSAILNTDYTLSTNTITFLPGETIKTVTFNALSDSINEGDETVLISIVDNTRVTIGTRGNTTVTIKNKSSSGGGGGGGGGGSSRNTSPASETPALLPIPTTPVNSETPTTPLNNQIIIQILIDNLVTQNVITLAQAELIKALLTPTAPALPTTPNNTTYTRDLDLNSQGDDVLKLQQFLISKGYSIPNGPTNFFGPQTQAALANYQRDNNITPALGYFGPVTRSFIEQQ
jgi:hypothetical protein